MTLFALALLFWLSSDGPAFAGFLVPLLIPVLAGTFLGGVIALGVNVAVGFGLSYIASKLLNNNKPQDATATTQNVGGVQLSIRVDSDVPQSLLVGTAVTAGSLVYAKTYGTRGDIDNSDLIQIIALADHRCHALRQVFVEGLPAVLRNSGTNRGSLIDGYTGGVARPDLAALTASFGGVAGGLFTAALPALYAQLTANGLVSNYNDLLAVKFFDGSQTTADDFTVSALSGATQQPWTTNMVGTSLTYVRTHSIFDRDKVSGQLAWRFVVDGIHLYDPRKDSTVSGGSGAHRWGTLSTYEWTDNVAVICYNILRGIYVADSAGHLDIFYGLEGTTADQLPLDVWFAAMNECDVSITLTDGTTEKQYRCGAEIGLDTEPLETIKGLLKASGGRFVEIGGIYKLYLGAPGTPVLSFDDGQVLANREDHFKPFIGLEQRVNYVTGSYTSPADGWVNQVSPPRENTTWRAEDGRRLPADLAAPMVQSPTQMQRLQLQMLNRARQQRQHNVPLPPQAMILEPGDCVSWTSARNNYTNKLFEVETVDYETSLISTIAITEVDPADYVWSTSNEVAVVPSRMVTIPPAPKAVGGFDAQPYTDFGNDTARPAVKLTWTPPTDDDVIKVDYQIRKFGLTDFVSGSSSDVKAGVLIISGGLQPLTPYEVRAQFESFNGYTTTWSFWVSVTTPDVRTQPADLTAGLKDYVMNYVGTTLANLDFNLQRLANVAADQDAANFLDKKATRLILSAQVNGLQASITETAAIATTISGRLGAAWYLTIDVNGYVSGIAAYNDGLQADFIAVVDHFYIAKPGTTGGSPVPVFTVSTVDGTAKLVIRGDMYADGSITASKITVTTLSAISANVGRVTAGKLADALLDADSHMIIDLANGTITGYA